MRYIILKHPLVAVWIKALLDAAGVSPLCGRQLCLQERQDSDKNDEDLLVGRPVVPRPSSGYVNLDLTWLDAENSAIYTSRIMRRIGDDTNVLGWCK